MNAPPASALEQAACVIDALDPHPPLADILAAVQAAVGYIPPPMVALIAEKSGADRPAIYRAIELSPSFSLQPPGKHLLYICSADNCCARGGTALLETARQVLGIDCYQCDATRTVRLEPFRCLGNCANGPNIAIDRQVEGPVSPAGLEARLRALLA